MKQTDTKVVASLSLTAAIATVGYTVAAMTLGVAFAIPVGVIGCIATAVVLRGPVGKALARQLEGGHGPDPLAIEEAAGPLVAHIEELRARLAEVEERLDFAERLLTQAEQPERLPGRSHR